MAKIVIIGAGIGGLSAAALLAQSGHTVTVIERLEGPGGRARVFKQDGFSFDTGPSWYMMPEVFERFFNRFNKHTSDFFKLIRLDPGYRIVFAKDDYVDVPAEVESIKNLFESIEPGAGRQLESYLARAAYKYSLAMDKFLYNPYKSALGIFKLTPPTAIFKVDLFISMQSHIRSYFKSPRLRKMLEWMVTFIGNSPDNAPALYSLLSYADYGLGIWYPVGGIGKLTETLYALAKSTGVEFRFTEEATAITVDKGKATGVVTSRQNYQADIVVANADYAHVETELLPTEARTFPANYWAKKVISPSAIIYYLGLSKRFSDKLLHHTLFFDGDWKDHFDSLSKRDRWPNNPLFYVCTPSRTDPGVAPAGKENILILVPVAAGLENQAGIEERYYKNILIRLEQFLGEKISDLIVYKKTYTVADFATDFNAYKGNAFGLAHTLFQTAIFRPNNRSKKVSNLYFTGHLTNPGVGMPLALISGEIVADIINQQ